MTAATRWIDSHCHLPAEPELADPIVERARVAGVEHLVCVGTDLATSTAAVALSRRHDDVSATVGLHPHDAARRAELWPGLLELVDAGGIVAIGEAGLDHHYEYSPGPDQTDAFRIQIDLAGDRELPLVIHTREAWDETFALLDAAGMPARTVFHCFTGGPDEAAACVDRGAWVSFSGIVTFKNAGDIRAAAAATPLDRILIETDSPYLAPVPNRGRTNEPAWVTAVGAGVAAARGVEPTVVAEATAANARRVFGIS